MRVKCLTKKCLVILDKPFLDFGAVYVGETVRERVTILNAGALCTQYSIAPVLHTTSPATGQKHPSPQAPHPTTSENQLEVGHSELGGQGNIAQRSNYSIMSDVETFTGGPYSSGGLGVITTKRLKSKSTSQIPDDQDASQNKADSKDQDAQPENQDQTDKSRPKSRNKSKPRPKSQETPKKSRRTGWDTPGKSRPGSRDTPSIALQEDQDSAVIVSQDTTQPRNQDTPQPSQNDTTANMKTLVEDGVTMPIALEEEKLDDTSTGNKGIINSFTCNHLHSLIAHLLGQECPPTPTPAPSAIQVGGVPSGIVPPFGPQHVELVFTPHRVAEHSAKFSITFSELTATPVRELA